MIPFVLHLSLICREGYNKRMPAPPTDNDHRQFAAAWVNSGGDKVACYRAIRPKTASDTAAIRGAERMLQREQVKSYITEYEQRAERTISAIEGKLTCYDPQTERVMRTIAMSEVDLINEYIQVAMLDPAAYYDKNGNAKRLHNLSTEQRRQIKRIKWTANGEGKRKPEDYELYDALSARSELAKIMGISNPAFDFAGLIALLTGKSRDEAQGELRRLDHSAGVNFDEIRKRAMGDAIEGEAREV